MGQTASARDFTRPLIYHAAIMPTLKKHVVTIYSRPGCHLCDVAKANILAAPSRDSFIIEEINVDADEALRQQYGYDIPVVLIDGIRVFKHTVDTDAFERKLSRFRRS